MGFCMLIKSFVQDYNKEAYADLMDFVERTPLKDGDKFIATLMRESYNHKNLGTAHTFSCQQNDFHGINW